LKKQGLARQNTNRKNDNLTMIQTQEIKQEKIKQNKNNTIQHKTKVKLFLPDRQVNKIGMTSSSHREDSVN
jgi:hypothetical protein